MTKNTLQAAAIAALLASVSANAALEPRLGGKAYYDTETNLTWAAPVEAKIISEQVEFVSNLFIDGIGGWRIPDINEFSIYTGNHSTCSDPAIGCIIVAPLPPLDSYQYYFFGGWNWVSVGTYVNPFVTPHDGFAVYNDVIYTGYSPALREGIPDVYPSASFSAWPVHTGDVALIPEPSTYAMLLAGLWLIILSCSRSNRA